MATATKSPRNPSSQTRKAKITTNADRTIVVEREFDAPRDKVWRAYTEPTLLAKWWGRGNKLDIESFELKPQGRWRFVERPEGEQATGFEGYFREVTPKSRIVQTFEWDGMRGHPILETAEFTDLGDNRTKVVSTSLFFTNEEREGFTKTGFEGGMNQSYDALDRLLASGSI